MEGTPGPVRLEALMTHAEWVRRVAFALVADGHEAADLEQDLWAGVLERPPRVNGSVRGWIAATLRNRFLNGRRSGARREARERSASRPEAHPSTADLVADAEAVRLLMAAVLELEEPYRTTVLLRFHGNLKPAAVAARMGCPVETARTRLRRALALLRDRLGRRGGVEGWLGALLPIAGLREGTIVGTSGGSAAGVLGGAAMTGKSVALAAIGLGLVAGFVGGRLSGSAPPVGPEAGTGALLRRIEDLEAAARPVPGGGAGDAEAASSRIAEQDRRIRALEEELAVLGRGGGAEPVPGPREGDREDLSLKDLTGEELLAEIRRLSRSRGRSPEEEAARFARTLLVCDEFLLRASEAPQRIFVLTEKGFYSMKTGDLAASDAALREALVLAGPGTAEGRSVTYRLAVTTSALKDHRGAADLLFGVGRDPGTPEGERAQFRVWGASYLKPVDGEAALAELRSVVEEFGSSEDPTARHWVEEARRAIKLAVTAVERR